MAAAPPPPPALVNNLSNTSFIIIKFNTNIKDINPQILTASTLDPSLTQSIRNNALPFVNSIKLKKSYFKGMNRADIIKTLFLGDRLKSIVSKALEDEFFTKGSYFNPATQLGGDTAIVENNIKVYLELLFPSSLFSKGISLYLNNNFYEINNAVWEHAKTPTGGLSSVEESGNHSWLVSSRRMNNNLYKTYNISVYLDLEVGNTGIYSKLSSKCDERFNKIREISHKNPVTKAVITFLYGPNVNYKRKTSKKKGKSVMAPPLYGTYTPRNYNSARGGKKKRKTRKKK